MVALFVLARETALVAKLVRRQLARKNVMTDSGFPESVFFCVGGWPFKSFFLASQHLPSPTSALCFDRDAENSDIAAARNGLSPTICSVNDKRVEVETQLGLPEQSAKSLCGELRRLLGIVGAFPQRMPHHAKHRPANRVNKVLTNNFRVNWSGRNLSFSQKLTF